MKRVSWLKAGHSNTIFSVRDIVSGTDGAVLQSYEYTENGEKTVTLDGGIQNWKTWVGGHSVQDETADTDLYLMGHRWYSASAGGRFLSRDPIGFTGGMNLYSYASNSPVSLTDAWGLIPYDFSYFAQVKNVTANANTVFVEVEIAVVIDPPLNVDSIPINVNLEVQGLSRKTKKWERYPLDNCPPAQSTGKMKNLQRITRTFPISLDGMFTLNGIPFVYQDLRAFVTLSSPAGQNFGDPYAVVELRLSPFFKTNWTNPPTMFPGNN